MLLHLLLSFVLLPSALSVANVTNSTNSSNVTCETLYAVVPPTSVGWYASASASQLAELADYMLQTSTLDCPVAQSSAQYIVVANSPGHVITFGDATFGQIISFGAATLCIFIPLTASDSEMKSFGLSPVLDKASRKLLVFFSVDRMDADGSSQNGDEMIVDLVVTATCTYVLMFSSTNRNGRTIESEGGKKVMVGPFKVRFYLPHTSSVAGYDDGTSSGSSSGLYGLFALIVLPILFCFALVGYLWYSWYNRAESIDLATEQPAQPQPQRFQPQTYMPQAYHPQQAYLPQSYIPQAMMPAYLPRV